MISAPKELSPAQLDALLVFLPFFQRPEYVSGEWHRQQGGFPFWRASPEVTAFVDVLYREQFITPFNWGSWAAEAQRYVEGGEAALADADLETLRKLMTVHARADRFASGTLAALVQNGHIAAVLRRLGQIRATMDS